MIVPSGRPGWILVGPSLEHSLNAIPWLPEFGRWPTQGATSPGVNLRSLNLAIWRPCCSESLDFGSGGGARQIAVSTDQPRSLQFLYGPPLSIVELLPGHSLCKRDSSTSPNIPIPVVMKRRPVRVQGSRDTHWYRLAASLVYVTPPALPCIKRLLSSLDCSSHHISFLPYLQCPPSWPSLSQLQSLTNSTAVLSDLTPRTSQKLPNKTSNALSASLTSKTLNMLPMLSLTLCAPPSLIVSKLQRPSTWTIWEVVCTQSPSSPVTSRS